MHVHAVSKKAEAGLLLLGKAEAVPVNDGLDEDRGVAAGAL